MYFSGSFTTLSTLSPGADLGLPRKLRLLSSLQQEAFDSAAVFPWELLTLAGILGLFACGVALALLMRYGTAQGSTPVAGPAAGPAASPGARRTTAPKAAAPELSSPIFYRYQSVWPRLLVTRGDQVGMVYPLPEAAVHIGSGPENDITLTGMSLASAHIKICHRREGYYLCRLQQDAATLLNGRRLEGEARLRHNDQIELGRSASLCYRDK